MPKGAKGDLIQLPKLPKRLPEEYAHLGDTKKAAFLTALAETGNPYMAAAITKIGRASHYRWLEKDPEYARLTLLAKEQAIEKMESLLMERIQHGTLAPIVEGGKVKGYVRKVNDTLLMFYLNAARPLKYRGTGSPEAPPPALGVPGQVNNVTVNAQFNYGTLSTDELAQWRSLLAKLVAGVEGGTPSNGNGALHP